MTSEPSPSAELANEAPNEPADEQAEDTTHRWLAALLGCGCLCGVLALGGGTWWVLDQRAEKRARTAERAAVEAALAVADDARIRSVVADQGFATLEPGPWPLVDSPSDAPSAARYLTQPHGGGQPEGSLEGKGVVVREAIDGTLSIDRAHWALADDERAERREEVAWVAILRRQRVDSGVTYGELNVDVERADGRLVRLADGRLIAQLTAQALPPDEDRFPRAYYALPAATVAEAVGHAWAEPLRMAELELPADPATACPDMLVPALRTLDQDFAPCVESPLSPECEAHCLRGHGRSCIDVALALEASEDDAGEPTTQWEGEGDADDFFVRACVFGEPGGCVNWAAGLDPAPADNDPSTDPSRRCAAQLFELACEDESAWGCGMFGTALMEGDGVPADPTAGKELLRARCSELGGGACYALAQYQARGAFGVAGLAEADATFARACEPTIDPSACGARAADFVPDLLHLAPPANGRANGRGKAKRQADE